MPVEPASKQERTNSVQGDKQNADIFVDVSLWTLSTLQRVNDLPYASIYKFRSMFQYMYVSPEFQGALDYL